jgi:hypothetical protein
MGITIHYSGKINDLRDITRLQEELADICETLNWSYEIWNYDMEQPFSAHFQKKDDTAEIQGHLPLRGVTFIPHPKVETVSFLFNPDNEITTPVNEIIRHEPGQEKNEEPFWVSVKTQYAPPSTHITLIKLLFYLKKAYLSNLNVVDEGAFWETGDVNQLLNLRALIFEELHQLRFITEDEELLHDLSQEELVEKLEFILSKYLEHRKNKDDATEV